MRKKYLFIRKLRVWCKNRNQKIILKLRNRRKIKFLIKNIRKVI